MKLEFLKKKGVRESVLGAAALASASAAEASPIAEDMTPTYEVGSSQSPDTPEESEHERIDWENEPRPPSIVESLNPAQFRIFHEGFLRFREYAKERSLESAAYFISYPDGRAEWHDLRLGGVIISEEGQQLVTEGIPETVVREMENGARIIFLHVHLTKSDRAITVEETALSGISSSNMLPSDIDMREAAEASALDITVNNPEPLQAIVVTEVGGWRFGFKSKEAANSFLDALESDNRRSERIGVVFNELVLVSEIVAHEILESYEELGMNREEATELYEIFNTVSDVMVLLVDGESRNDFKSFFTEMETLLPQSHAGAFVSLLERIDVEEGSRLSGIDPDSDLAFDMPPVFDEEGGIVNFIKRWEGVGAYIEEIGPDGR